MKTIEKLYEEIKSDSELKKEYIKAAGEKKVIDFLKAHDCDATVAELDAFISSQKNKELDDDELDMVSGGDDCTTYDDKNRPIVTYLNSCDLYKSDYDGKKETGSGMCYDCYYFHTADGWSYYCSCPERVGN